MPRSFSNVLGDPANESGLVCAEHAPAEEDGVFVYVGAGIVCTQLLF